MVDVHLFKSDGTEEHLTVEFCGVRDGFLVLVVNDQETRYYSASALRYVEAVESDDD